MHEHVLKREPLKLLRMRDLTSEYGLSPASVYRWIKEGIFPLPISLGPNSVAWKRTEIEEWESTRPRARIRPICGQGGAGQRQ